MVSEVSEDYNPVSLETKILEDWNDINIYVKLKQLRSNGPKYFFLDGPPYMNGMPHIGHARTRALRDPVLKYKSMNGYNVWHQPGFDIAQVSKRDRNNNNVYELAIPMYERILSSLATLEIWGS